MMKPIVVAAMFLSGISVSAGPAQPTAGEGGVAANSKPVCKFVLASDAGAQPYKLCQSKAQWTAMEAAYAKDANRMVCHYEDVPGTKVGGHKLCGPQSAWEARRAEAREQVEKIQMGVCVPGAGC